MNSRKTLKILRNKQQGCKNENGTLNKIFLLQSKTRKLEADKGKKKKKMNMILHSN